MLLSSCAARDEGLASSCSSLAAELYSCSCAILAVSWRAPLGDTPKLSPHLSKTRQRTVLARIQPQLLFIPSYSSRTLFLCVLWVRCSRGGCVCVAGLKKSRPRWRRARRTANDGGRRDRHHSHSRPGQPGMPSSSPHLANGPPGRRSQRPSQRRPAPQEATPDSPHRAQRHHRARPPAAQGHPAEAAHVAPTAGA